jgi:hypothetical protein
VGKKALNFSGEYCSQLEYSNRCLVAIFSPLEALFQRVLGIIIDTNTYQKYGDAQK